MSPWSLRLNSATQLSLGRLMVTIFLSAAIGFGGLELMVQASIEVPTNCFQHTEVGGVYDQYYELDAIGNIRTEDVPIDFHMFIEVRNFEEEIAMLLSNKDRTHEYPDYARTYEIRLGNVYTVIYRETLKMQAYHSPKDKLFPGDQFKLRIRIRKEGNITITIDDNDRKPLIKVYDGQGPLDVRYISFASRMNEYPITFHFACNQDEPSTEPGPRLEALRGCPACPKQKCEVIVKACTDQNKDAAALDPEKQKYYFYFNMYVSKKKGVGSGGVVEENLLV